MKYKFKCTILYVSVGNPKYLKVFLVPFIGSTSVEIQLNDSKILNYKYNKITLDDMKFICEQIAGEYLE